MVCLKPIERKSMSKPLASLRTPAAVALGLAASTIAGSAHAASVCVVCDGKSATYECVLPSESATRQSRILRSAEKLICMKAIAERRGHASCSVRRGIKGICTGEIFDLARETQSAAEAPATAAVRPGPSVARPSSRPGGPEPQSETRSETQSARQTGPDVQTRSPTPENADTTEPAPKPETAQTRKPEAGAPKTMVELAKRTVDATDRQIKKTGEQVSGAGEAVTGAIKKSWTCVTSLFSKC